MDSVGRLLTVKFVLIDQPSSKFTYIIDVLCACVAYYEYSVLSWFRKFFFSDTAKRNSLKSNKNIRTYEFSIIVVVPYRTYSIYLEH